MPKPKTARFNKKLKEIKERKEEKKQPTCQAYTKTGDKCSRLATFNLDLTQGTLLFNKKIIPPINCCFMCTQHAGMWASYGFAKLTMALYDNQLSWDEYITIHPEYIDTLHQN